MKTVIVLLFAFPLLLYSQVLPGADILVQNRLDLLKGKRVGLVTNQTGRLQSGEYLLDALVRRNIRVVALFGPEHGIRGEAAPGEIVDDTIDRRTGIRVYSLYGKVNKPTGAMLDSVDMLIYDIQDVGVRYYTFISTMYYVMESAAQHQIPLLVLDRPDPLGGTTVDGPVLEDSLKSFVGMMPIPVVYGLTCGELAQMINGERWLEGGAEADLTVIPMKGWRRSMKWSDTGLPWIPPSPNIPDPETCFAYPVTCFLEATNVSEGRGTDHPFQIIGAPFINGDSLAEAMTKACPSIHWEPAQFTPRSSKHQGSICQGVRISVDSLQRYAPTEGALSLLMTLSGMYPEQCIIREKGLARLAGTTMVQQCLLHRISVEQTLSLWREASSRFEKKSLPYRIYR
ncbi:MAG: DUF1343 domain-containing protein [Bacteroidota bacterium]